MRRTLDLIVACYVTIAAAINSYLAVRFWRGIFK
jgi:hypothetical protein